MKTVVQVGASWCVVQRRTSAFHTSSPDLLLHRLNHPLAGSHSNELVRQRNARAPLRLEQGIADLSTKFCTSVGGDSFLQRDCVEAPQLKVPATLTVSGVPTLV